MNFKKVILVLILLLIIFPINAEESSDLTEDNQEIETVLKIKNITKDNEYIVGSVLQIQDENGFVIDQFTTSSEEYTIENIEDGTYYLVQISVPNEFDLNPDRISINISEGINNAEILNERSIILPGDMSSNSILLISMAMLDITIVIGVIVYVKKNKVKK